MNQYLVSVMIPVYEPNQFLIKTLESVLQQVADFAPTAMQIVILDDASPTVDVKELISHVHDVEKVDIHRNVSNLGLSGNWNRAIELAQGEFIHILHHDDVVLPGFYKKLVNALQHCPQAGMAFCRHAIIGADDEVQRISHRERWRAGILDNWMARISMRTRIQCPAAMIRRSTYQAVGNFRTDLKYALDWEMWVRIAVNFSVWYEPQTLALYRRHAKNESARLANSGVQEPDVLKTIATFSQYLPVKQRESLTCSAYKYFARSRLKQSDKLLASGATEQARSLLLHVNAGIQQLPFGWLRWRLLKKWQRLYNLAKQ